MPKPAPTAAAEPIDIDLSSDRAEIRRRQQFLGAMLAITGVSLDQLATRAAYGARNRDMQEMEQAAERKITGVLNGDQMLSHREWQLLVGLLSGQVRSVLRDDGATRQDAPGGVASIFNRQEKKLKERRALILRCCLDLSGETMETLALRAARAGTEFAGTEAAIAAAAAIAGNITLSPGQWWILSQVFIAAALQALDREEKEPDSRLDQEPGSRAEHDARFIAACMLIGDVSTTQAVQRLAYVAKSFGIESFTENLEKKFQEITGARCVMSHVERAAVSRVILTPAIKALEAELPPQESTASVERFASMISGSLELMETRVDDVAPAVSRLAGRWFMGRLETDAKGLLKKFLDDPAAVVFTPEERRVIASSLFPVPLRKLKAESDFAK